MRVSERNINNSIRVIIRCLVENLVVSYDYTENQAILFLIITHTYALLMNRKSRLYAEFPEYVMDMLKNEMNQDWDEWLKI